MNPPSSMRWLCAGLVLWACGEPDAPQGDSGTDASSGATEQSTSGTATTATTNASATSASTQTGTTDATQSSSSTDDPPTTDPTDDPTAGSEGGLPAGCYDYDAFEPSVVEFRADVMPILAARCSSCHLDSSASIYFGQGGTSEVEAAAVYDKLLNGPPKQAPDLAFAAPGDPLHSYMLAKIEYPNPGGTCAAVQCAEPGCELPAPPAGPLDEAEKAVLRSWVINGALDD